VNAVGPRQARRLALTATRIDAAQALALGLVQQVVAADQLDAAIASTTTDLLAGGPQAQREIKQLFERLHVGPVSGDTIELTAQTISRVRGTAQARQGFAAFMDKKPPPWAPK
jgi:methylglutaconyl-CoA hydratase